MNASFCWKSRSHLHSKLPMKVFDKFLSLLACIKLCVYLFHDTAMSTSFFFFFGDCSWYSYIWYIQYILLFPGWKKVPGWTKVPGWKKVSGWKPLLSKQVHDCHTVIKIHIRWSISKTTRCKLNLLLWHARFISARLLLATPSATRQAKVILCSSFNKF